MAIFAGVLHASPIPWSAWGQIQLHLRDGQCYQGINRGVEVHATSQGTGVLSCYHCVTLKGKWGTMSKTKLPLPLINPHGPRKILGHKTPDGTHKMVINS